MGRRLNINENENQNNRLKIDSPIFFDSCQIPKTTRIITGKLVSRATIGVGLSIINGRKPTTNGRLRNQLIFSGISESDKIDTLLLAERPASRRVITTVMVAKIPDTTKSIKPWRTSEISLEVVDSFKMLITTIAAKKNKAVGG